ncbi:MAG: hypothetical protein R3E31_00415 [Chloroflexota bacterium]
MVECVTDDGPRNGCGEGEIEGRVVKTVRLAEGWRWCCCGEDCGIGGSGVVCGGEGGGNGRIRLQQGKCYNEQAKAIKPENPRRDAACLMGR